MCDMNKNQRMSVSVATGFDEIVQAISIRAAVYVGEQGWSFKEEWDGNDFSATHLLARVDGDPAGTLRIRYFQDFVKVERLAVLPQYRRSRYGHRGVALELGDFAYDFCRRKGFSRFYGLSAEHLTHLWRGMAKGYLAPMGDDYFDLAGKPVVPMFGEAPPAPDAIKHDSGHFIILRTEGQWDKPGYWEMRHE